MAKDDTVLISEPPAAHPDESPWGGHLLDLDAYLERTGYTGPRAATLACLRSVARAHLAAIPFENVDVALGRDVSLDLADIQHKLVRSGRGGYCFEHNLLFAAVLERFGLPVTRLLARVRQGRPTVRYRAHTTLLVEAEGRTYLTDVGFGAEGPLAPLPLAHCATVTVGGFRWRLVREGDQWVLQSLHDDGWFDLYSFRLERHHSVDFDVSNFYTAHHPRSTFTGKLVAMRGDEAVQRTLTNGSLHLRHADGRTELVHLSADEAIEALRETFAVRLGDSDARSLKERLSTSFSSVQEA
ncbi:MULTISPECIES: arylamine N-acetyltransferase [unclassified Streptomyces]|uniref:arylamine N-acetyltransferase family protein n=1 Tax=unclassified Streptomyces TaxID=2593676 RepID=UPI0038025CFB